MENQNNNQDFTELRSLLANQAEVEPRCDLEDGFLHDLHSKIRSESLRKSSLSLLWERVTTQFENAIAPSPAMSGVAFATIVLALGLGIFFNNKGEHSDEVMPTTLIKADNNVDYSGAVPAFYEEPTEF